MEVIFNPFDPAHYLDPHPRLARLREQCPISEPTSWFMLMARDEDIRAALRNVDSFSNAGNLVFADEDEGDPPTILQLDPPEHTHLRRLQTHMNHTAISAMEPSLVQLANQLISDFIREGRSDLMAFYANSFPLLALMLLLGVPEDIYQDFHQCAVEIKTNLPYAYRHLTAWVKLKKLVQDMVIQQRSEDTPTTMLTHLVRAEHQNEHLTDEDIRMAIFQLIGGGSNALSLLIGNVVYRLLEHRDLWERLQADTTLVPLALEESLRYDSPAPWVIRLCRQKTTVRGKEIPVGKRVILSLNSGNRDAAVWSEPDIFSLDRLHNSRAHLGFGYGPHFCLGAALTRLLGKVALEALLHRLPELRLPENPLIEKIQAAMLHGPARLEVLWHSV